MENNLLQISMDLNFEYNPSDEQDWGIINSDPERVREFINYYISRVEKTKQETSALSEIIIASMDDALKNNIADNKLCEKFVEFVSNNYRNFPWHIEYWLKFNVGSEIYELINKAVDEIN